jgi:hypothetical protein
MYAQDRSFSLQEKNACGTVRSAQEGQRERKADDANNFSGDGPLYFDCRMTLQCVNIIYYPTLFPLHSLQDYHLAYHTDVLALLLRVDPFPWVSSPVSRPRS